MNFTPNSIISHSNNNIDDFLHGWATAPNRLPAPPRSTLRSTPTPSPTPGAGCGGDIAYARRTAPEVRPSPPSSSSTLRHRALSVDIATLRSATAIAGSILGAAVSNSHRDGRPSSALPAAKTAGIDLGDDVKLEPLKTRRAPRAVRAAGGDILEEGDGAGVGGLAPTPGAPATPRYTRGGGGRAGAQDAHRRASRLDAIAERSGTRVDAISGGGDGSCGSVSR
ncbi:hypothetical protein EDC01DRAFT_629182 [Geopyxis carbonaria]|nr:hypothetical protein EDC01DRAFT_629182 [Geopyxis carbonaria]